MTKPLTVVLVLAAAAAAGLFSFNGYRVYQNVEQAKAIPLGTDSTQLVSIMGAPHAIEPRQAAVPYPTYARISYRVGLFIPNACVFELNDAGKVHAVHTEVGL